MHKSKFRLHFTRKDLCIPYGLFMLLFVVFPLFLVLYYAFTDKTTGQFTFNNFATVFSSQSNFKVIGISILVGLLNTLCCLIIAYPIAYFLSNKKSYIQNFIFYLQ